MASLNYFPKSYESTCRNSFCPPPIHHPCFKGPSPQNYHPYSQPCPTSYQVPPYELYNHNPHLESFSPQHGQFYDPHFSFRSHDESPYPTYESFN